MPTFGSFRRGADELGYTQSSISHQVVSLERVLGTELFTRPVGRGAVKLTTSGEEAYRRARRALGEVEAIGAVEAAIAKVGADLRPALDKAREVCKRAGFAGLN